MVYMTKKLFTKWKIIFIHCLWMMANISIINTVPNQAAYIYIYIYIYISIYISIYLYLYLSTYIYLSIYLSIYQIKQYKIKVSIWWWFIWLKTFLQSEKSFFVYCLWKIANLSIFSFLLNGVANIYIKFKTITSKLVTD